MNFPPQHHIEQLRHLDLSLRSQLEQAEARVQSINENILQLARMQAVSETAILGLVLFHDFSNASSETTDSGHVVQAALTVPAGFGVINWRIKQFASFCQTPPPDAGGFIHLFIPFDQCSTGVKTLLLPHVQPLLDLLFKNIRAANQDSE